MSSRHVVDSYKLTTARLSLPSAVCQVSSPYPSPRGAHNTPVHSRPAPTFTFHPPLAAGRRSQLAALDDQVCDAACDVATCAHDLGDCDPCGAGTPRLRVEGVDWSLLSLDESGGFDTTGLKQEEIVNLGIKDMVLRAFVQEAPSLRARL